MDCCATGKRKRQEGSKHDLNPPHEIRKISRQNVQAEAVILLRFLLRIALLANFAFLLRSHAALVRAVLTRGFRLLAAGFGVRQSDTAEERESAED